MMETPKEGCIRFYVQESSFLEDKIVEAKHFWIILIIAYPLLQTGFSFHRLCGRTIEDPMRE